MTTKKAIDSIAAAIYRQDELYGCRIVYHVKGHYQVIHPGLRCSRNCNRVVAVIEEIDIPKSSASKPAPPPSVILNKSKFQQELIGFSLNYLFTVWAVMGVVASAGAIGATATGGVASAVATPVTGGLSAPASIACWVGFAASTTSFIASAAGMGTAGIQLCNSGGRLLHVMFNGDANTLQLVDDNKDYTDFIDWVDRIGLGAGAFSLATALPALLKALGKKGLLLYEQKALQEFNPTRKAERTRILKKALASIKDNPAERKEVETLMRQLRIPEPDIVRLFAGASTVGKHNALKIHAVISAQATQRLQANLKVIAEQQGNLVQGLIPLPINATSSEYVGAASGHLNTMAADYLKDQPSSNNSLKTFALFLVDPKSLLKQ